MELRPTHGAEKLPVEPSTECPWASPLWGGPPGLRLTSWSALAGAYFGPPTKIKNEFPNFAESIDYPVF